MSGANQKKMAIGITSLPGQKFHDAFCSMPFADVTDKTEDQFSF